jgi:hypothetical protein
VALKRVVPSVTGSLTARTLQAFVQLNSSPSQISLERILCGTEIGQCGVRTRAFGFLGQFGALYTIPGRALLALLMLAVALRRRPRH